MITIKKQKGFSLMEILIALSLLMVLITATQPIVGRLIDFKANIDTDNNINILGSAIEEWYSENAWEFGQVTTSTLPLPNGGTIANNTGTSGSSWERLALNYSGSTRFLTDGYNHHYRVFVSNPQVQEYRGVLVPYHVIAIASSGGIGENLGGNMVSVVETEFNQGTGLVNIRDNDSVYIINGFATQKRLVDLSIDRLERIARSYENFYQLQFSTKERDPAINYFARNGSSYRWDLSSQVVAMCGLSGDTIMGHLQLGHNINNFNLLSAIGVSSEAAKSGWGEDFRLLNCGSTSGVRSMGGNRTYSVRTPNSPSGDNIPPYSAILGFHLPNGETYTTTITSSF